MDDGSRCLKYIIFIVNLFFVVAGLIFIAFGAALFFDLSSFNQDLNNLKNLLPFGPWLILIFGIVVFFIAFLGCCGAIQESKCMLICFAVILFSLFVVKLSFGIVLLVKPEFAEKQAAETVQLIYEKGAANDIIKFESALECCGLTGPSDYYNKETSAARPCLALYKVGCQEKGKELIKMYKKVIAAVFIAIAVVEGVGVLLVSMLVCSISSHNEARLLY